MTQFYLIRHGEADYPLADIYHLIGGAREWVPLTALGEAQVAQMAQQLRDAAPQLIVTSPITRALQTAAILSRALNLPLDVEFDLHEWIPDLAFRWASGEEAMANFYEMMALGGEWPEGETRVWEELTTVHDRAQAALHRYTCYQKVFVVCHGAVIRSLTGEAIDVADYRLYELPEESN